MIDWVVGGLIAGVTVYIIVRTIMKIKKGESSCCGGCTSNNSNCNCTRKP